MGIFIGGVVSDKSDEEAEGGHRNKYRYAHPSGCHSASPRVGGGKRPRTTGGKRGTLTSTTLVVAQAHPSATTRVE